MRAFVASLVEDAVMVTVTAEWGTYGGWRGERVVTDGQEALALCADIEANEQSGRVLVGFTSASGRFFAVGLGSQSVGRNVLGVRGPSVLPERGNSRPG